MDVLKKLNDCEKQGSEFLLRGDCADIKLVFLTDEIVRIRCSFEKSFPEESYVLMTTAWEDRLDPLFEGERKRIKAYEPSVDDGDGVISFASKKLTLHINKDPFEMVLEDAEGEKLFSTTGLPAFVRDSNNRHTSYVRMKEDDAFYGFGEKTGPLNKNKMSMRQRGTDAFGYDPLRCDTLYKHIPFYIRLDRESRKAVGVFYHNFYESVFNMGAEKSNYWPRYSYYQTDGGDLDMFLIGSGAISKVIDNYTLLTGRPALLPKRALGYQGSSMYYAELSKDCDQALLEFVDTVHQEGFPIDGFHLSSGYTSVDGKRCVFEWNNERFKDPAAFFEGMAQAGAAVVPNVKPGVLLPHPEYAAMEKEKVFVRDSGDNDKPAICRWWGGEGSMWDFTDPGARKVWKKYLAERVVGLGVDSVWNDNCEYDGALDKDALVSFDGKGATLGALKPIMANLMCKLSGEVVEEKNPDVRPYSVCRAGAAGIQRYAQTWCGDNYTCWEALRGNLPTILGMGLSGQPAEGADIGGFAGPVPSKELFVRWVQNGIFQPRFSIHSASDDNTVTEPWMYPEVKELIKELILFRYRMIPYMYSLEYEASECGAPLMRPLVYEFQEDVLAPDIDDEFMLGSDILVANVLEEGADSRMIYLPQGSRWYDMNDDFAMHQGGQIGPVKADLETVPMFIREGAIVPFALNQPMNLERDKVTGLHLYLAPEEAGDDEFRISTFTLYDDDGVSNDYKKGVYLKTQITMTGYDQLNVDFVHEGAYVSSVKDMLVEVIRKDRAPISVELEGLDLEAESSFAGELTHFLNYDKFMAADSGWYYHMSKRTVLIKYENPHQDYRLSVSFREFDLIGL